MREEQENKKKRNAAIDLAKFVMAVFVVVIHVRPFSGELAFLIDDCITRVANPLFFVISSYFLFYSLEKNRVENGETKWNMGKFFPYIKRLLILYTIWFALNLPNFMWQIRYNGWRMLPVRLFQAFFLSGPFDTALWFLPALLWGVCLTFLICRLVKPRVALLIGFLLYSLSLFDGSYQVFMKDAVWYHQLVDTLEVVFLWLANGFTYGLCYCALGACIAVSNVRNSEKLQERKKEYKVWYGLGTLVSLALYLAECVLIRWRQWGEGFGAQLMMIPFSYFCLQFLLLVEIKEKPIYRFLQKMSIVVFGVQFLVIYSLRDLLVGCAWYANSTTVQFGFVLAATCGIAAVVVWLSEHTRLKFLKYLY